MKISIQVYISTYGNESSQEFVKSKRIQNLFLAYKRVLHEIIVADLNQELIQARNSVLGIDTDQSILQISRVDLADRLGLVKSGQSVDASGVDLPQAFLILTKDQRVIERNFLGHFDTIQYLEDCGILAKILTGEICAHYRQFKSHVFYPWCKPLEKLDSNVETCAHCHLQEQGQFRERLVLVGNFLGGQCSKTHDLSIFFESNKLPYTSLDPLNAHLKSRDQTFVKVHSIAQEAVRLPKIFIHNKEVTIKKMHEFAAKGLLVSILRSQRCQTCQKKTAQCECVTSISDDQNEVTSSLDNKSQSASMIMMPQANGDRDSSVLFVVQEEVELEQACSTAKKVEERKVCHKKIKSGPSLKNIRSKENLLPCHQKKPVEKRSPNYKAPLPVSSGIGKGLAKTPSKTKLIPIKKPPIAAASNEPVANGSLLDLSNQSLQMDRSVFYKSYFGDVSDISHVDESQLFLETKIMKDSRDGAKAAGQTRPSCDFTKSKAKPVTFNGVTAAKQTRGSLQPPSLYLQRRKSPQQWQTGGDTERVSLHQFIKSSQRLKKGGSPNHDSGARPPFKLF